MHKTKMVFNMDKAMRNLGYLVVTIGMCYGWVMLVVGAVERMCN